MPAELNIEQLAADLDAYFTPDQRLYISRLLHDHVSNPVLALSMQVEIIKKMIARQMDITDELAHLQGHVTEIGNHVKALEITIKPPSE